MQIPDSVKKRQGQLKKLRSLVSTIDNLGDQFNELNISGLV